MKHKNHNYFNQIDNESKAYFLGLLFADGYVSRKTNQIQLFLLKEDLEIIKEFKKQIKYSGKITLRKNLYGISPSSPIIKNDLINLGCVPNKSKIIKFPKLEKNFHIPFIRGYFDGDGTLSLYKNKDLKCNFTCASIEFIEEIKNLLLKYNIQSSICSYTTYYRLFISGNNNSLNFLNLIYNNSNLFLARKKEKYFRCKNIIENNIKRKPHRRKIIQFNKENIFIKEYNSAVEAERCLDIRYQNIRSCCEGKQKTAGGYVWKWK